VIVHAETSRVLHYIQADDRDGWAEYVASYTSRLEAAGAQPTAIPAVAPHFCLRKLMAISLLPVLNI
jgi:aspartate/glutamate racemase